MWDAYQTLPPADDRRRLHRLLRETVQLLHDDAGVCHGEIKEYNVIIHGTDAWLIDFGSASLRARLLDKTWSQCKQQDITCLDAMFLAADSRDARGEPVVAWNTGDADGPDHVNVYMFVVHWLAAIMRGWKKEYKPIDQDDAYRKGVPGARGA
ncbi:Serine/threonine-protein kinase rio1 [Botryosphaeria dothidea]